MGRIENMEDYESMEQIKNEAKTESEGILDTMDVMEHVEDMETMDTMFLTLDDDTEMECGVLGIFEVEGYEDREFIALVPLPTKELGEEGEAEYIDLEALEEEAVLIYGYREEGDEITLENIEDDTLFEAVSTAFYDLFGAEV